MITYRPDVFNPDQVVFIDDFVNFAYNSRVWGAYGTGTGGSITSQSTVGGWVAVAGAVGGGGESLAQRAGGSFSFAANAWFLTRCSMAPAALDTGICEIGLQSSSSPTTYYVKVQSQPSVSANFQFTCSNAGATTVVDSGVVADTGNHWFGFVLSASKVDFYIDDAAVGTCSTNLSTQNLNPYVNAVGSSAAVSTIKVDFVECRSDRV